MSETTTPPKQPFDIDAALKAVEEAVRPYPKAGLFTLWDEGYQTAFEQLVACIISIRTLDEVMLLAARRLLLRARTPAEVVQLTPEAIAALIHPSSFYEAKARQIHVIAQRAVEDHGGALPCDEATLLSFTGVGPKCANLVLSIACGLPRIGVDIHVHRVVNRWGYVQASTPEATLAALQAKLPAQYHIELNRWVMPFGKFICTGSRPHCSTCPLLEMCPQIGVTAPR